LEIPLLEKKLSEKTRMNSKKILFLQMKQEYGNADGEKGKENLISDNHLS
jgi:hypothetical protein